MGAVDKYKVNLSGLRNGEAKMQIEVDDTLVSDMGNSLLNGANAVADLCIKEKGGEYSLNFHVEGMVKVPCDRCLEDMDVRIDTDRTYVVKLGDTYLDDGEVTTVPADNPVVDVAWMVYEILVLEIPLTHAHQPGECNEAMAQALQERMVSETDEESSDEGGKGTDPRWDSLKSILDNN